MADLTRGERNRNPGNIRHYDTMHWLGLADPPADEEGYCRFIDDYHGLRALGLDLKHKWDRGLRCVMQIINAFAPPEENDTQAYIVDVSKRLSVKPAELLDFEKATNLAAFMRAIIWHENGRCLYTADIMKKATDAVLRPNGV